MLPLIMYIHTSNEDVDTLHMPGIRHPIYRASGFCRQYPGPDSDSMWRNAAVNGIKWPVPSHKTSSLALRAAPHGHYLVFQRLPAALMLAPGLPGLFQRLP
jgi:hypothetical protein